MALGNVDFSDPLEGIQYSPPSNNLNHKVQNILIPKRDSVSSIAKRPKGKCQWEMIPYLAVYTTYICTTYSPCLLLGYMLRTYLPTYHLLLGFPRNNHWSQWIPFPFPKPSLNHALPIEVFAERTATWRGASHGAFCTFGTFAGRFLSAAVFLGSCFFHDFNGGNFLQELKKNTNRGRKTQNVIIFYHELHANDCGNVVWWLELYFSSNFPWSIPSQFWHPTFHLPVYTGWIWHMESL